MGSYQAMIQSRTDVCYNERCESLTEGSEIRTACDALSNMVGDLDWSTIMSSNFDVNDCASFISDWESYNLDSKNVDWAVNITEFSIPSEY